MMMMMMAMTLNSIMTTTTIIITMVDMADAVADTVAEAATPMTTTTAALETIR